MRIPVQYVGPRPPARRRLVAWAAALALTAGLGSGLAATPHPTHPSVASPPAAEQRVAPSPAHVWGNGWGVSPRVWVQAMQAQGWEVDQARLAAALLDRLAGPQVLPSGFSPTPAQAHALALRALWAEELKTAVDHGPATTVAWAANHPDRWGAAVHAATVEGLAPDAVAWEAWVGWTADDAAQLEGLLQAAQIPMSSDPQDWQTFTEELAQSPELLSIPAARRSVSWSQARRALQASVDETGLAHLRVSAWGVPSASHAQGLAERLEQTQSALNQSLGLEGPVLGLGGRVWLDVSWVGAWDVHGQVVPGDGAVAMRSALHALGHEHFHAWSVLWAQQRPQASAQAMTALLATLSSEPSPGQEASLLAEARMRLDAFLRALELPEELAQRLRNAEDTDAQWESLAAALSQDVGLMPEDVRMVLGLSMALSPRADWGADRPVRWVALRTRLGDYLLHASEHPEASVGHYVREPEEILAAAYGAQLPTALRAGPIQLGILDEPGRHEAQIQAATWRAMAPHVQTVMQPSSSPPARRQGP